MLENEDFDKDHHHETEEGKKDCTKEINLLENWEEFQMKRHFTVSCCEDEATELLSLSK